MYRPLLTILAFALASPTLAQSYSARNDLTVAPLADGAFEVIEAQGAGARGLWCAAGDYARDQLNSPSSARLYVVVPRSDSQTAAGRKAVTFALTPQGTVPRPTVFVGFSTRNAGSTLSVAHAVTFCAGERAPGGL
ncbi:MULTISPECIES: hypothetical protein [Roseobacteraceae]|uniref:Uncharacterized protein n=1 Tax=Pseudosulfitobacter pseudonitzschiae TaxID=1402135 RepID=A0A221K2U9_9RHOB|nr:MULTISPECIES: hypothetical protein [Roseobacteraceae]ASM73324.1 hypothetical protein SULPSESMR1_02527 [Pseudosulfitobacter pseudonitzschiae]